MPTDATTDLKSTGPHDDAPNSDRSTAARAGDEHAPDDDGPGALDRCPTCGEPVIMVTTRGPGDSYYQPCGHAVRRDTL